MTGHPEWTHSCLKEPKLFPSVSYGDKYLPVRPTVPDLFSNTHTHTQALDIRVAGLLSPSNPLKVTGADTRTERDFCLPGSVSTPNQTNFSSTVAEQTPKFDPMWKPQKQLHKRCRFYLLSSFHFIFKSSSFHTAPFSSFILSQRVRHLPLSEGRDLLSCLTVWPGLRVLLASLPLTLLFLPPSLPVGLFGSAPPLHQCPDYKTPVCSF